MRELAATGGRGGRRWLHDLTDLADVVGFVAVLQRYDLHNLVPRLPRDTVGYSRSLRGNLKRLPSRAATMLEAFRLQVAEQVSSVSAPAASHRSHICLCCVRVDHRLRMRHMLPLLRVRQMQGTVRRC